MRLDTVVLALETRTESGCLLRQEDPKDMEEDQMEE